MLRTKDEREKLQSEIDDLELRLAVLKKRAGIGGEAEPEQPVVLNSVLRSLVTQQQMAMAGVQSMVAKSLVGSATVAPFASKDAELT